MCLQDSLLTVININTGASSSLINYNEINSNPQLQTPKKICSLSSADNFIFIGVSRDNENDITNILIKLKINNNEGIEPSLNKDFEIKVFVFPENTTKTNTARQITCQPLRILNNNKDINYYLVCVFELITYDESFNMDRYYDYAISMNDNFDGFNNGMRNCLIYRTNITG